MPYLDFLENSGRTGEIFINIKVIMSCLNIVKGLFFSQCFTHHFQYNLTAIRAWKYKITWKLSRYPDSRTPQKTENYLDF